MGIEITIPEARMSFDVLGEPERYENKPENKPRWSVVWLIPAGAPIKKEIDAAIRKLIAEKIAAKRWKGTVEQWVKTLDGNKQKMAWQDGDTSEYDGYAGNWSLSTHRKAADGRPVVMDNDTQPIYDDRNEFNPGKAGRLYAGCYIRGKVELYAYDKPSPGIAAGFSVVQRLRKGDAFGGGKPADATGFDQVEEGADAEDLAAAGDDLS